MALLDTVPLPEPSIDLDGTTASHVTNTIGADLRLFIDMLQFDDNLVEGDLIAGHDIPRAVGERGARAKRMVLGLGSPGSTFFDELEAFPRSFTWRGACN